MLNTNQRNINLPLSLNLSFLEKFSYFIFLHYSVFTYLSYDPPKLNLIASIVGILKLSEISISNCVWMNKNSSPKSMTKVYLSSRIMFDMVCEPL